VPGEQPAIPPLATRAQLVGSQPACLRDHGFDIVNAFSTNFSVSFHTDHSKHPLRDKWQALRRKIKDRFKPQRKQPHLVVIARAPQH
jgi:hypothetical protein